jgi:radical SAM superfamily enzyme YgiQ (UPF0313 family)
VEKTKSSNMGENKMIRFISLLNDNMKVKTELGIEMQNQILIDNGYDSECIYFFYKNKKEYATSIEYAEYICELGELPILLKIIKNYKENKPLNSDIYEYTLNKFEINQLEIISDIDTNFDSLDISDDDVFCFTTTYISIIPMIYYALKVRSLNKNIKIVFGGYHVTLSKHTRDIISRLNIADTIVIGNGNNVILDIIEGKKRGIIDSPFSKNERLPDYDTDKINRNDGWITSITSYGCPNSCLFCASDRKWIGFDLEYIKEYHESLIEKYPNVKFYFSDDNINTSVDRFNDIIDIIVELNRPWTAFANPININKSIAEKIQKVPCDFLYLGAESFSDDILKFAGKPKFNTSILKSGIRMYAKHGISVSLGLIVGMPNETEEKFNETKKACWDLINEFGHKRNGGLLDIIPTAFKIFPNSQHYHRPKDFNMEFEFWDDKYANLIPEISDIIKKIPKKFHIKGIELNETRDKVTEMRKEYGISIE